MVAKHGKRLFSTGCIYLCTPACTCECARVLGYFFEQNSYWPHARIFALDCDDADFYGRDSKQNYVLYIFVAKLYCFNVSIYPDILPDFYATHTHTHKAKAATFILYTVVYFQYYQHDKSEFNNIEYIVIIAYWW